MHDFQNHISLLSLLTLGTIFVEFCTSPNTFCSCANWNTENTPALLN